VAHPSVELYGADRMLVKAIDAMQRKGIETTVFLPTYGPLISHLIQSDIRSRIVSFPVLRKSAMSIPGALAAVSRAPYAIRSLRKLLSAYQPDVLYVNTITLPHWVAAGSSLGLRTICHVRELEDTVPGAVQKALVAPLRLASTLIANSKATADHISRSAPSLAARTRVVHNGFEFPSVLPVTTTRVPTKRRRVLVVGRLSPRKGQDTAIEAVAQLTAEGWDLELTLVGSTFPGYEWYERHLRSTVHHRGLDARVLFSGFKQDVAPAYLAADIVLVPSRIEPFGNVAVEALGVGKPVVVSRVGGLPEIVDDGVTGLICEPADSGRLASSLRRLLHDPAEAAAMGQRGAVDVRNRFGAARFRAEFIQAMGLSDGTDLVCDRSTG
jgi:glycosyltransferase involved in cell wall biosynthesis